MSQFISKLASRTAALKIRDKWTNTNAPKIQAILTESMVDGRVPRKADGSLTKKLKDKVDIITRAAYDTKGLRCYMEVGSYSILLKVDINYQVTASDANGGYFSGVYDYDHVYLYNVGNQEDDNPILFVPRTSATLRQMEKAQSDARKFDMQIRELTARLSRAKRVIGE